MRCGFTHIAVRHVELSLVEPGVCAAASEEVIMGADVGDPALLKNDEAISSAKSA